MGQEGRKTVIFICMTSEDVCTVLPGKPASSSEAYTSMDNRRTVTTIYEVK